MRKTQVFGVNLTPLEVVLMQIRASYSQPFCIFGRSFAEFSLVWKQLPTAILMELSETNLKVFSLGDVSKSTMDLGVF